MDDRPKLAELQESVRTTKWYNLGIQLGLEDNDLEEIAKQNGRDVDDCRRAMFGMWLRTSSKPTRKQLLYALRTKSVAEISIADEYERSFQTHDVLHTQVVVPPSLPSKEPEKHDDNVAHFKISEKYHPEFDEKRGELCILMSKVTKILKNKPVSLDDLKYFLSLYRRDAETAESLNDAMKVVCNYTSLTNTKLLEAVAKEFDLQDAIHLIEEFNKSIDEFCETIQTQHIYGQDFMKHSHKNLLKSDLEEVKFVLEWEGDKTTLKDIQSLLRKAFHDNARHVMVKVVNEGNSIIVICYAPLHLHEELIKLVKDNEEDLRKEKVHSVTIGGLAIIIRETTDKLNSQEYWKEKTIYRSVSMEEQDALRNAHIHENIKKISIIDTLSLEVTERQLLNVIPLSGEHDLLTSAMKETDLSKTDLHVRKEQKCPDNYEFQYKQESDPVLDALKSTSALEVAHFFSIYDLQVTEQQKIKFLSLTSTSVDTQDFQFPIEMYPLKLLVSVIHNTEFIQKGMEAELSRERELSETYRKRSFEMMRVLHAKKLQIEKIQRINVESQTAGVDVEALQPEEVLLEAKEILLEEEVLYQEMKVPERNELRSELPQRKDELPEKKEK